MNRHALEVDLGLLEDRSVHDALNRLSVREQTLHDVRVGADLEAQRPLIDPLTRGRAGGFVLQGHGGAVPERVERVHAEVEVVVLRQGDPSADLGMLGGELVHIRRILQRVHAEGLEGVERSFGLEQLIGFLQREVLPIVLLEQLVSHRDFGLGVPTQEQMLHGLVPSVAEDKVVVLLLRAPSEDVLEEEPPRAVHERRELGRIHDVPSRRLD